MKTTTLTIKVDYDPEVTDPESLAQCADNLLEMALSTPGIVEEYGEPSFDAFLVENGGVPIVDSDDTQRIQFARIIWEMDAACQSQEMLDDMAESMDLEPAELQELIAGAIKVFEKAKERATGVVLSS